MTREVAVKLNVTKKEDGKFVPFIVAGVPSVAGLFLSSRESDDTVAPPRPDPPRLDPPRPEPLRLDPPRPEPLRLDPPRLEPVVFEGGKQLSEQNGFSVWENGHTPPLAVEAIVPEGGVIALESVTPNGQVVRNLPISNLATLQRSTGETVAQVVQFEMEIDEITASRTDIVVLDKNGEVVSRARVGKPENTAISVQVVPFDGPPGSRANLQIQAGGLFSYLERNVFGWDPGQLSFAIDYTASGGASGPTKVAAAPFLSIPIVRGIKEGQITVRTEQKVGK